MDRPIFWFGILVAVVVLFRAARRDHVNLDSFPWVARRKELFSKLRAGLRGSWYQRYYLEEGYEKVEP